MIEDSLFSMNRFNAALGELLDAEDSAVHGYTPASGLPALRRALIEGLEPLALPLDEKLLYVTCGASAGRAILVRALLNAGDEVLFLYPPEKALCLAVRAAGAAVVENGILTGRTRMVVLSGRDPVPAGLAGILREAEKRSGQPVYLLADRLSPTEENLALLREYDSVVLNEDFGDSLSGESIGFLAVGQRARDAELLFAAITGAARACGYVNPPSLLQHAILSSL